MIYLEFIYKDHVYRATINCLVSLKNYCKEETREFNFGRIQFNSNCTKELKSSVIDYLINYTTGVWNEIQKTYYNKDKHNNWYF